MQADGHIIWLQLGILGKDGFLRGFRDMHSPSNEREAAHLYSGACGFSLKCSFSTAFNARTAAMSGSSAGEGVSTT